ncbi:MAG: 4-hydroxythreonine-4-phosphate dehydrogenase PdxA [Rikenellaceae bacterium]
MDRKLKIGITHGDINGISYEIIIKALYDNRMAELFTPVIYGSAKVMTYYKNLTPECSNFAFNIIDSVANAVPKKVNLINCIEDENPKIDVGTSTHIAGQYAVASLNKAMRDLASGEIDAVVTCPINKSNVQSDQFDFVGHTELFASTFGGKTPLMFMIGEDLRVGILTNHEPLVKVSQRITAETVLEKLRLMKQSLIRDFSITEPKIAILGINPHAGDCGLLGKEEEEIIIPAIASAKYEGILSFGPFASDGFFGSGAYKKYDAVLAMYHDQGMIPFKLLAPFNGVNYTAGLSVIRTSPAHGVGYDIAGKNVADAASLRAAIYAAIDIHRSRDIAAEIEANPLKSYSRDSWGHGDAYVRDMNVPEANDEF